MRIKECPQKCYVNIKCPMQMIAIVVVTSSKDTCCVPEVPSYSMVETQV